MLRTVSNRLYDPDHTLATRHVTSSVAVSRGVSLGFGEALILLVVIALVTVRFFTERIVILPRMFNAIDLLVVPVLVPVALTWVMGPARGRILGRRELGLACLVAVSWVIAWLANYDEVHWIGGVTFIAGLLTPILFFLAITNAGLNAHSIRRSTRVLEALLVANLVLATGDIAPAILDGTAGPDSVLGTYGLNPNQLAFFLAVMLGYRIAQWRFQGLGGYQVVTLVWTAALFSLNGFQTLWVVFTLAVPLVLWICGVLSRRTIGIAAVLVTLAAVLLPLTNRIASFYDLQSVLAFGVENFDDLGKVELIRNVPEVWKLRPAAPVIGLGPGTFNSRAFRNIAVVPYGLRYGSNEAGAQDVAAAVVEPFYYSEMSSRFIIPYFERPQFGMLGHNIDGPFTSYVSIPMEIGMPGALMFFAIYVGIIRALVKSVRSRTTTPDERVFAAWALLNLLLLLGISTVDNYLELTRATLLVWFSVAIWKVKAHSATAVTTSSALRMPSVRQFFGSSKDTRPAFPLMGAVRHASRGGLRSQAQPVRHGRTGGQRLAPPDPASKGPV